MKRRLIYLCLSISCFIACAAIVIFLNDNRFIRGFVVDIIIILLIYFLIKAFYDFNSLKLVTFTLALSYITEFSQYLQLAHLLGLEHNPIARLVIGSVFDPYDLIAYTIGAFLVYLIDTKLIKKVFKSF